MVKNGYMIGTEEISTRTVNIGNPSGLPSVVERIALGKAVDRDGTVYGVVATKLSAPWPGTSEPVSFAVERYRDGQVVQAWGFFSEHECFTFLSDRKIVNRKYTGYDRRGKEYTFKRNGLGIPDSNIERSVSVV